MWHKTPYFLFLVSFPSCADDVALLYQHALKGAQNPNLSLIPEARKNPKEVALKDPKALEKAQSTLFEHQEVAQTIRDSAMTRPYFPVGYDGDPLLSSAEESVTSPDSFLKKPLKVTDFERSTGQKMTCLESNPQNTFTCTQTLIPGTFTYTPPKYSNWGCTSGAHGPDDPNCRAKKFYNPPLQCRREELHFDEDRFESTCHSLEGEVKAGRCRLITKECVEGPGEREVMGVSQGKPTSRKIHKPCWRYELTYVFTAPQTKNCESFKQKGCIQVDSTCREKFNGKCVLWEQTYQCPEKSPLSRTETVSPFGDINGEEPPLEPANKDMDDAVLKLELLKEVQENLRQEGTPQALPSIFKGNKRSCTIAFADFKNCCTDGEGWGVSLGLSGCSCEEKDLAERKSQGLCHEIGGTYCAEKVLGVCIRKKRGFCCFPSKLSRILHEEGRRQLGISWGTAKEPNCRGFTPEELARLNFDQLNLGEVMQELKSRIKDPHVLKRNLTDRVRAMQKTLAGED